MNLLSCFLNDGNKLMLKWTIYEVHITDTVIPRYSFAKKFTVTYPDHIKWKKRNIQSLSKGPVWYTDRSKSNSGTGGDVFGGKTGLIFSLGAFATVFQQRYFP